MRLYEYDANGRYSAPALIEAEAGLDDAVASIIRVALAEKREVRITDSGDALVFHAQNGEIVFPTEEDIARSGA